MNMFAKMLHRVSYGARDSFTNPMDEIQVYWVCPLALLVAPAIGTCSKDRPQSCSCAIIRCILKNSANYARNQKRQLMTVVALPASIGTVTRDQSSCMAACWLCWVMRL